MFEKIRSNKNFKKYIIASVVVGIAVALLCSYKVLYTWDAWFTDGMYQHQYRGMEEVHVIGIDERTLMELGDYENWDRGNFADLVEALCKDGNKPAVIAFDILFTGHKTPEGDERFVKDCAAHGNVIAGTKLVTSKEGSVNNSGQLEIDYSLVKDVSYPFEELNAVVDNGFVDTQFDRDGRIRTTVLSHIYNNEYLDSLAVATYRKYCDLQDLPVPDYSKYCKLPVYFDFADRTDTVHYSSFIDVINGTIDAAEFDNEIVLVGGYAEGLQDDFMVGSDRRGNMYGVAIHANIIKALDSGFYQVRTNTQNLVSAIVYGIVSAVLMFVLLNCSLPIGGAVAGGILAIFTGLSIFLYRQGLFLSYIYLALAIVLMYLAMIFYHYISVRLEKAKINNAFKMYVSSQVVEEVSKSGTYELRLGGETKDIACLFIDIRGFTSMSEGLDPETVVNILNEYFAVITDAIFKNGGTLDKFIGDAAMAVFNSPFDLDDYEMRAIRSALDIAANSEKLRNKLMERFGRTVNYGIGINCGPATVGNIGCDFRMDFTAIGDTVNTASRLESNAKAGQILISEALYERVKDKVVVEDVGGLSLKGKVNVIHTFNVLGIKEE